MGPLTVKLTMTTGPRQRLESAFFVLILNAGAVLSETLLLAQELEPILPADYRSSFVEVRGCRFSLEHGGVFVRVLANPEAAEKYEEDASPLPAGSVIAGEEYRDDRCEESGLIGWRVMRKEPPGYDPADGDWHWQVLTPGREVVEDSKTTCIGCHTQPACARRDRMCAVSGGAAEMKPVLDGLPATLFSITGTPSSGGHTPGNTVGFDIYTVGADPRDGRGPFFLHYDGAIWRRLVTGARGDLWWISERMIDGGFYLCGEDGLILRFDPASQGFEPQKTPGDRFLFGVWGTDRGNLWAVGGDLADEDRGGALWRFNGTEWVVDERIIEARPEGLPTLYKAWGRNAEDIWVVGRLGVAYHFDGARWQSIPTGASLSLFTVHGNQTRVAATGVASQGVILELEGDAFVNRAPPGAPQMNGVFVSAGGIASAVGAEGSFAVRGPSGWEYKTAVAASRPADFHGTWIDAGGGVWAAGGDVRGEHTYGLLAYAGEAAIGSEFASDAPCAPGANVKPGFVSYTRDVVPLLSRAGCLDSSCHGGAEPASEYHLGSYEGLFGPGKEARNFGMCDVVPGNLDQSFLLEKVGPRPRVGERMPNGNPPLRNDEIALLRTWIFEGAVKDEPVPRQPFSRGDVDASGGLIITDPIALLRYLFVGDPAPVCLGAADANDDGTLGINDGIFFLNYLFLGGPEPAAPFPTCGLDPTPDDLECTAAKCP